MVGMDLLFLPSLPLQLSTKIFQQERVKELDESIKACLDTLPEDVAKQLVERARSWTNVEEDEEKE